MSMKFAAVVDALDDMRTKGIIGDYGVGGAVAATLYYQPIATVDLDIFFLFEPPQSGLILSLETIYNYARECGYEFDKDFIYIGSWPVQFIEAGHDLLWSEGLRKARSLVIDGRNLKVIPPEYLAVMWLQAGRGKDIRKIQEFDEGSIMERGLLEELLRRFSFLEKWRGVQDQFSDAYKF